MITTDDIMALAGAFADAEDADFALHTLDELRAAVAALVAERDLAIHEQDTAQESLRRHQMWLQEAQAERDALRTALLEVLEFQSDPKAPTIHDFGRWRRLAQPAIAGEQK